MNTAETHSIARTGRAPREGVAERAETKNKGGAGQLPTLADLDVQLLEAYCRKVVRLGLTPRTDQRSILRRLRLWSPEPYKKGGSPNEAACLLFGRNPQSLFPEARVRLSAHFLDVSGGFDYQTEVKGAIPAQIEMTSFLLSLLVKKLEGQVGPDGGTAGGSRAIAEFRPRIIHALAYRDYDRTLPAPVDVLLDAEGVHIRDPASLDGCDDGFGGEGTGSTVRRVLRDLLYL